MKKNAHYQPGVLTVGWLMPQGARSQLTFAFFKIMAAESVLQLLQ